VIGLGGEGKGRYEKERRRIASGKEETRYPPQVTRSTKRMNQTEENGEEGTVDVKKLDLNEVDEKGGWQK